MFSYRSHRLWLLLLVAPTLLLSVPGAGHLLWLALWCGLVLPLALLGLWTCFGPPPLMVASACVALTVTLMGLLSVRWNLAHAPALVGMLHLVALPGALVGVALALASARRRHAAAMRVAALLLGLAGLLLGDAASVLLGQRVAPALSGVPALGVLPGPARPPWS